MTKKITAMNHNMKPGNAGTMHRTLKPEGTDDATIRHCIMKPEKTGNATIRNSIMKPEGAALLNHIMKLEKTGNATIRGSILKPEETENRYTTISRSGSDDPDKNVGTCQTPNHINPTRTGPKGLTPTFMAPAPNWIFPSNESSLPSTLQQTDLSWPFDSTTTHQQQYYTTLTTSPIDSNSTQSTYTTASEHGSSDPESVGGGSGSSQEENGIFTSLLTRPASAPPNASTSPPLEEITTQGNAGWTNPSDSDRPYRRRASDPPTGYESQGDPQHELLCPQPYSVATVTFNRLSEPPQHNLFHTTQPYSAPTPEQSPTNNSLSQPGWGGAEYGHNVRSGIHATA
jgi:hypothetical protein